MQTSAATPPADAPAISPAMEDDVDVMLSVPITEVTATVEGPVASCEVVKSPFTPIGPMVQDCIFSGYEIEVIVHLKVIL